MKIFMRQIGMAAFASVVTFTGIAPAGAFQVPQMPSQVTSSSDIIKVQDANGQGSRRQFEEWRRRPGGGDWDRRGDRNRDRNWDRRSDNNRDWDRRRPSREWDRRRPPRDWDRPSYRAGYYNGHRGYRYRRPGYRYYDGFWFPLAAFGAGAIIGGAIASPPPVAVYPGSYSPSHVQWCLNRYRSYRASDNSFVPYTGYRQQCVSPYS